MDQSSADIRSHLENSKLSDEIAHESNRQCTNLGNGDESKFPQRIGQPDCQYFLRTGDCKYGTACRYHHPLDRGGSLQREIEGEKACAYYTRTGACKFGLDCKFHHPQPGVASPMKSLQSSAMRPYPASDYARYNGTVPVWYMANPYFPSSYMPMFAPPTWIPCNKGPMRLMTRMDEAEKSRREPSHGVLTGTIHSTDDESEESSTPRQADFFPEREGEPECRYYLRTGGCKFGSMCKFHHPKDRGGTPRTSHLNAIGLPLRPGQAECSFYLRRGICKYGWACKFHHPEIVPAND